MTESINKQYSKYGSLRMKEKESKIELCNAEDPLKFLTRIDSSIKDAKARVKQSIDNSTISEDYESSFDQINQQPPPPLGDSCSILDTIPMVKFEKNKSPTSISYGEDEDKQQQQRDSSPVKFTNRSPHDSSNNLHQSKSPPKATQSNSCYSNNYDSSGTTTSRSSIPTSSRQL